MKVLTVFGTCPEGIKLAPVVKAGRRRGYRIEGLRDRAAPRDARPGPGSVRDHARRRPGRDAERQSLAELTGSVLLGLTGVVDAEKPDFVVAQGDTTTTFAASLAAYYGGTSRSRTSKPACAPATCTRPGRRRGTASWTSGSTRFHFAPTDKARDNLLREESSRRA